MTGTLGGMRTGQSKQDSAPVVQTTAAADQQTCVANVKHDNAIGRAKVVNPAKFCRANANMLAP